MIGQTISHYKILEKLGEGGMGVVYKAQDTKLDRMVALKFLPHNLTANDTERARFLQEAKAAAVLNHPNVCVIYGIEEYEGQQFIEMEYVDGVTLKHKFSESQLKINDAIGYSIQIGEALQEAHSKGIVHRDVKSENMMVNSKNQVKVMDFGLAKLRGSVKLTKSSSITGTLAYMAPEQIQGQPVDARADIFSFGVVLYEMLTGHTPFRGEHEAAMMYSILNEEPQPISPHRTDVPEYLHAVIVKALEKDRTRRYRSVQELLTDLRQPQTTRSLPKQEKSIVVLPFKDISPEKDQEYFCDGLAEELTNSLTRIKGVHVVARTSAFSFKTKEIDIREIGKNLNVKTVLEGSVRKAGNQLRITAQLVNVDDGYHLWSERYDRQLDDVFAIQDEISLQIVNTLKIKLESGEKEIMVKRYTEDVEAYNLYARGRYFRNKITEEGLLKGIEYFQQAIEKDPAYALAYGGMADCYALLGWFYYLPSKEAFPKAKAAAQKALEIDENLSEAHTSLGLVKMVYDRDWTGAEKEFERAIELNPSDANARLFYSIHSSAMGRHQESIAEATRAHTLDPLTPFTSIALAMRSYYSRQYDHVIEQIHSVLEMDPNVHVAHYYIAMPYAQKGMFHEALEHVNKAIEALGKTIRLLTCLGVIYTLMGKKKESAEVLDQLLVLSKEKSSPFLIAEVYAVLENKNHAFEWLEKAYEERDPMLIWLKVDPILDIIRSDPRFIALLKKMGLSTDEPKI